MLPGGRSLPVRLPLRDRGARHHERDHKCRALTRGQEFLRCGAAFFGGVVTEDHEDSPFCVEGYALTFKLLKPGLHTALNLVADGAKGVERSAVDPSAWVGSSNGQ